MSPLTLSINGDGRGVPEVMRTSEASISPYAALGKVSRASRLGKTVDLALADDGTGE